MRSLTEIKGDEAFDFVADMMEPVTEIMADENVAKDFDKSKVLAIKTAIKGHKKAVKQIVALINEQDVETYEPSVAELYATLYTIIADKELQSLFTSQSQKLKEDTFGSVTENTKAKE